MKRTTRPRFLPQTAWLCAVGLLATAPAIGRAADATALLRAAFDNWRADSSETSVTMTIHRPASERHLGMKAFTQGRDKALVRFTAPAKVAGNATLKLGVRMWIYNPKLNQVIKLPASLQSQSWMGSDFSYNDLAKAEDILTDYTHKLVGSTEAEGHTVYVIDAVPKPGAPVIWGKQQVKVRDDAVLLEETFFDQDLKAVRRMTTEKVARLGGREYPVVLKMQPLDKPGQWTRVETTAGRFNIELPDYLFTRSNLENPRD